MAGDKKRPLDERLDHIAAMEKALVDGRSPTEAVVACCQAFGFQSATGWRDYKVIKKRWARKAAAERGKPDVGFGLALLRRDQIYRVSITNQDPRAALEAEQDRCKLLGLYPDKSRDHPDGGRATTADPYAKYRLDPVGYARDVLKATPTPDQERIARSVLEPPYRVLVKSGHNIGKSWLAAWLVNWWFDTRDPGVCISTAPNQRSVVDVLWAEIRLMRQAAGLPSPFAPAAPVLRTGPDHWAKGYTTSTGEGFQGRHRASMLFVFDEAEGVDAEFWRTTESMFQPDGTSAFLAILNPTTTTSKAYQEEQAVGPDGVSPKWHVESISALNHPNVLAGLRGEPPPVPGAVTLDQVRGWIADWFEPVTADETDPALDVEFPPGSGQWFRPGPDGEARVLGRRPTAGAYGVWTEQLFTLACQTGPGYGPADLPEVGCDVARFGTDKTEIHVRVGGVSVHHEEHGGWDTVRVAARLADLADEWVGRRNAERGGGPAPWQPKRDCRIKVDDTGVGGGVTDILAANGYNVVPVNAGSAAHDPDLYPNARSELWFQTRDRAKAGRLDLSRLGAKRLAQLKAQALAPVWAPDAARRRVVESKEHTQKRLGGRSPDGMDAVNLSYYESLDLGVPTDVSGR